MLLAIDVGNTNTVFAIFNRDAVVAEWRIGTDGNRTADEYAAILFPLLQHVDIQVSDITAAIASFVVPAAVFPIKRFCYEYFNVTPIVVGEANVKTDLKILMDQPSEVGADMIVNAVAAWNRHAKAMVIIDFGTATTFQVTNSNGEFIGGCIAPGINLSIEALHMAAAQLPTVEVADPGKVIGTNTVSAIQSGIFYGYIGLIEGIVTRIKDAYADNMLVIATGGLAPLFNKATPIIDVVEQDLIMHGLRLIYQKNC
ncbi:MAG: type III pantothenate kinase [Alphaproteobacteria bacterium]|nr:type III pantothenate kinase [Alphaproteobacteria bacterium]